MFRKPDIPTMPKKKFSEANFEEERTWLERKRAGKIYTSETAGELLLVVGTAALLGFIVGGSLGIVVAYFLRNLIPLVIFIVAAFFIALYILKGSYSIIEVDPERGLILYEGSISLGGEYRSTRYRGSYQIIDGTLLVRFRKFRFLKSRPFIRFVTRSGYLRMNFQPEEEDEILRQLEQLGLVNISLMQEALYKSPVRVEDSYLVYFQKNFDREAFRAELKSKQNAEHQQEEIDKRILRKQLIEESKEFVNEDTENDDTAI